MRSQSLLPMLALCALGGCITPDYHCRIICGQPGDLCPAGFSCVASGTQKLCAKDSVANFCPVSTPVDAGPEAPSPPVPDAAVDTAPADLPSFGENPSQLCYAGSCLTLSAEMRQSLVLWLDPSTLPAKDMPVARWADRSREANDAVPLPVQTPPRSRGDGLELSALGGGPLFILHDPSLNLDAGDFTIVVVARVAPTPPSCLLAKASFDRANPRGVVMGWTYSTELMRTTYRASLNGVSLTSKGENPGDLAPHLFVLRREGDAAETRIDGRRTELVPVARSESLSTEENVFLGSCGSTGAPISVLHAAIAFRGSIPVNDLALVEGFLMGSFPRP
jgi:hypothetical protein